MKTYAEKSEQQALLAEIERLRAALRQIASVPIPNYQSEIAKEALEQ